MWLTNSSDGVRIYLLHKQKRSDRRKRSQCFVPFIFLVFVISISVFMRFVIFPAQSSIYLEMKVKIAPENDLLPHIILLLADDLGFNDVGWANDDFKGLTPTLDALRKESIELTSYYTQQLCTPARAALLTGRYPFKIGMQFDIIMPAEKWGLPVEFSILPQYLSKAGYKSYAVGKWHLGHYSEEFLPQNRGFEEFYGYLDAKEGYYTHIHPHSGFLDFMDSRNSNDTSSASSYECVSNKEGIHGPQLHTDRALDIVKNWKNSRKNDPLFLYMAYQLAHSPLEPNVLTDYSPVDSVLRRLHSSDRKKLAKLIYQLDLEVKRLLVELEEAGILDNAIVIFASDNGGCHAEGSSNYPLRGSKGYNYEGGSKVRSFIHSPLLPNERKGKSYSGLFHVSDWLPTIMDAAIPGWSSKDGEGGALGLDGISHWEALQAGNLDSAVRNEIVYNIRTVFNPTDIENAEDLDPRAAIRVGKWKYIMNEACQIWPDFGGRYDDYKYWSVCHHAVTTCNGHYPQSRKTWLFNLEEDPYETTDLSLDHPEIVEALHKRILDLAQEKYPSVWRKTTHVINHQATSAWAEKGCIGPWS